MASSILAKKEAGKTPFIPPPSIARIRLTEQPSWGKTRFQAGVATRLWLNLALVFAEPLVPPGPTSWPCCGSAPIQTASTQMQRIYPAHDTASVLPGCTTRPQILTQYGAGVVEYSRLVLQGRVGQEKRTINTQGEMRQYLTHDVCGDA